MWHCTHGWERNTGLTVFVSQSTVVVLVCRVHREKHEEEKDKQCVSMCACVRACGAFVKPPAPPWLCSAVRKLQVEYQLEIWASEQCFYLKESSSLAY